VATSSAQEKARLWLPPADTPIQPHDFNDSYYPIKGVESKLIVYRRTGADGLSVLEKRPVGKIYNNVRVLVTVPAYDQNGGLLYWSPLGDPALDFFTGNKAGVEAREMAKLYPIYLFPGQQVEKEPYSFANNRQAPIIDDTWSFTMGSDLNPLGLRRVFFVNYTEAAFTKENAWIMEELANRNGMAADDTPIIKSVNDLQFLFKYEMITTANGKSDDQAVQDRFMIAPVIRDPTKGVIAKDAFIWMAEKGGKCLPTEEIFETHFNCLKDSGAWCSIP